MHILKYAVRYAVRFKRINQVQKDSRRCRHAPKGFKNSEFVGFYGLNRVANQEDDGLNLYLQTD